MNSRTLLAIALALALTGTACTGNRLSSSSSGEVTIVNPGATDAPLPGESLAPGVTASASPSTPGATSAPSASARPRANTQKPPPNSGLKPPPSSVPVANIWSRSEDRVGISATTIKVCMHAAFLLGPAFGNSPQDEDVYWKMVNDPAGPYKGIYGRRVDLTFQDDKYTPQGATEAFEACRAQNPFFLVGGVGFDQTPTFRKLADDAKIPYFYSIATEKGPDGRKYDGNVAYTAAPTVEQIGRAVGGLTTSRYRRDKIGVVWVDSPNWKAGRDTFVAELKRGGMRVEPGADIKIASNNEANFATVIKALQDANVTVVYLHINALAMSRFITQSDGQNYYPRILGEDGFNLVTDTVGPQMRKFPPAQMVWVTPAYPDTGAVPWSAEMKRMRDAYAKYRPQKDKVNDVDWMFWMAFKGLHQILLDCGPDCTRNKIAGLILSGYQRSVEPACPVDFAAGGGRFGGHRFNLFEAKPVGSGSSATSIWHQVSTCVRSF